ncbi:alpha-2-macroglobulin receptor-associated protein precursor, partial [Daubentonia madagascariensis]
GGADGAAGPARGAGAAAAAAAAAARAPARGEPRRQVLAGEEPARAAPEARARGGIPHGEAEPAVGEGAAVILAKYGLDGKKDARQVDSNSLRDGSQDDVLDDPPLEKLWHKAKTSGKFSSEELDRLWREFMHHKEKVHEYNVLLEALSRMEDVHENVISPSDLSSIKGEVLHSRHAELKEQLRSINQGLGRLRKVSHQGY